MATKIQNCKFKTLVIATKSSIDCSKIGSFHTAGGHFLTKCIKMYVFTQEDTLQTLINIYIFSHFLDNTTQNYDNNKSQKLLITNICVCTLLLFTTTHYYAATAVNIAAEDLNPADCDTRSALDHG